MADYIPMTDVSSESSNADIKVVASSDVVGPVFFQEYHMTLVTGNLKFWTYVQQDNITEGERELTEQIRLFEQIPESELDIYRGRYVIAHNGEILDADEDLDTLTSRFFGERGDMPVYVAKIGEKMREVIDTPF